ncbi:aldose 1-epimerase [Aquimarina sp. 2201CG5-10]|uniref:aldose 1-epimerase n=1 Tax=Aquimarina callyspongiae TaxID=3098150 RepID=UPI002AB3DD4A|nr:aldose 1-epimerase [Aquimarina sp. 2201CG5-10]MDY8137967.1 aldose 1-epimerase [Aquimarina sp. 2201CG5-10]
MFKINYSKDPSGIIHSIELQNNSGNTTARINLNLGGSLQELKINNKIIINNLKTFAYNETFASAILFPFVNRIKNGQYTFQEKHYSLNKNQNKNALHGLVYNKKFGYVKSAVADKYASVTVKYVETEKVSGFPFKYSIYLTYKLTLNGLVLDAQVKNKDDMPLPFNIGWHPYFFTSNLKESYLKIDSNKKLIFDKEMIPIKVEDIVINESINLGDNHFDDCYILNKNMVTFKTPEYSFSLCSNVKENYLQVYTPKMNNAVAIEPVTGPANSFNHKLGLQILEPNEVYLVSWKIELDGTD